MRFVFILLTLLYSFSVFSQKEYDIPVISSEVLKNSNSIILEESIEINAENIKKVKTKTRRVVAVLNKSGENHPKTYEVYNENSRVKKISAQIYDFNGKRQKHYKKRDFQDVSRSGGNMYLDSRMLYLDHTPTFHPYIIVFESEVESGDSGLLNSLWFLQNYTQSLLKSEVKIKYNPENKIRYKGKNLSGYDINISETPEELILSAQNIPALKYENLSPPHSEIFPHVLLAFKNFQLKNVMASVEDWKSFGAWMDKDLLEDTGEISEKTMAEIKQLISKEETNEAKARKIYEFVQNKVRYVSIQIGIGGWKPMPASEVDELSYGDCKALTNYTKVLLDAVGIPSYYTIIYGNRTNQNIEEDFASIQGNHVILGIPDENDEITWLECTSQDLPFGYIGSFTDDRNAILLTPDGGKLIKTKTYHSFENIQETKAIIQLNPKGNIQADFESISKGLQYENKYFLDSYKKSEVHQYYKNLWKNINGFSITKTEFHNNKKEISFTEKVDLEINKYISVAGNNLLLIPNIFNQIDLNLPKTPDRKQNLKINRGFLDTDNVTFKLPSELKIESLPDSTIIENQFGNYEISFTQISDKEFEYKRKLHLTKGEFPPEKYEDYRDFIHTISRLDQTKILLTKDK